MNTTSAPARGLRFPLKKDRKTKAMMPVKEAVVLIGSGGHIAGMIRSAVQRRVAAEAKLREAAICADIGNHRAANIARLEAARQRRCMRADALWARIWADQVDDRDERLRALDRRVWAEVAASNRAAILSARWQHVQLMKFRAGLPDATRARIDRLLGRIALKHDALTPYGHTLAEYCEPRASQPAAA